jgi:hypothetical protein
MPHAIRNADECQGGGCQCGKVRYIAARKPLALFVCHCIECRKQSSSAFGVSFVIRRDAFKVVQGHPAFYARQTASGHTLECAFCPSCGSRLWHQSSGYPETLNVKGGSLDEPVDLTNAVHIWTASKLPGVIIPDNALCYPKEPDGPY